MGDEICTCLNNITGFDSEDLSREGNETDNNKNNNSTKKVNKKPKVVLDKKESLDFSEPLTTQRGKESESTNLNSESKNTISNQHQTQMKKDNIKKINKNQKNDIINNKNIAKDNNKNNNIKEKNENNNNNKILENNNIYNNNLSNNNSEENKKKNNNINNKIMEKNNNKRNININKNKKTKSNSSKKSNNKNEENNFDLSKMLNRDQMVSENFNKFFNSQNGQEMILNMNDTRNKI